MKSMKSALPMFLQSEGVDAAPAAAPAPKKASKPKAPKKAAPKKAAAKKPKKAKAKKGDKPTGTAVIAAYAPEYHRDTEKKTASGNVSVDNNDDLAKKLRGKSLDEVYAMGAKVLRDEDDKPVTVAALKKRYAHLNVGMQRMNLGNRIRAVLNAK